MSPWKRFLLPASVILLAGCTTTGGPTSAASPSVSAPAGGVAAGCASRVETGPLPEWARTGFSGDARMPHVMGEKGDIVAALFGHPLRVTREDGSSNKILWVSRAAGTSPDPASRPSLEITATLDGTDTRVAREVAGGPGPSIIDLPQAGCWHLELRWSGRTDTVDLVYAPE
ncbi:hypothetical protein FXF53_16485 [Micromonospora sp. WP24]|uniref:hypothetical protein n=1 Tax=Micromonospora sp. WP24 TaxID=2604469 RepID=UPI0011DAABDD|nr:hypothetical protein [Micromonospora sp. WP24]TYB98918.1 hypothetical protein FXF53_16485 [Micromonospora sp. WP24]